MPRKSNLVEKFINAASNNSGKIYIVESKNKWSVKREGSVRASAVKKSKYEALDVAKGMRNNSGIIIYPKQKSNSY